MGRGRTDGNPPIKNGRITPGRQNSDSRSDCQRRKLALSELSAVFSEKNLKHTRSTLALSA
jgi:hypothetical protein